MKKIKLLVHVLLIKIVLKNFLRWIIGVQFGQEKKLHNLKQCIYVANHNSHLDTACFLSIIPKERFLETHPIAAKDYFSKYKFIETIVKFLFNVILIERKSLKNAESSLVVIENVLKQGHSILFFPEGSRGDPEIMGEFKNGIAVLLKHHPHVPFVPVFMKGLGKAMPKGDPLLIPHESKILIGDPIIIANIDQYTNHEVAQIVRESILKLSATQLQEVCPD